MTETTETHHTTRALLDELRSTLWGTPAGSYNAITGTYPLTDGREVTVSHIPASDGGILLGCYRYRVADGPWRPVRGGQPKSARARS